MVAKYSDLVDFNHNISPVVKAKVLIEALPWIREFAGHCVVIKFGGNAMVNEKLQRDFAADIVFLRQIGIFPVVVHGGGPQISEMLEKLNITSTFKAGLRVTTPEIIEIARMVLSGKISRDIVNLINQFGPLAVGMSGEDAHVFTAKKYMPEVDGKKIDIGLVGDIDHVNTNAIINVIDNGQIPVISTIAPNSENTSEILNVNADFAAAAIACALHAKKLMVLTDVEGYYLHWPDRHTLVQTIGLEKLKQQFDDIESGMRPKLRACMRAIEGGVPQAHIIDGREPHSILNEVFTQEGVGTMVVPGDGMEMRWK
ncbi:MAG: acetylglutamate kinase [Bifidobacteriaceae bacterium]|nr:acetylglutamate kinase [Bifidobacteriaceae bacterium]